MFSVVLSAGSGTIEGSKGPHLVRVSLAAPTQRTEDDGNFHQFSSVVVNEASETCWIRGLGVEVSRLLLGLDLRVSRVEPWDLG